MSVLQVNAASVPIVPVLTSKTPAAFLASPISPEVPLKGAFDAVDPQAILCPEARLIPPDAVPVSPHHPFTLRCGVLAQLPFM